MIFLKRAVAIWHIVNLCLIVSCQTTGQAAGQTTGQAAARAEDTAQAVPAWVLDPKKAYPESAWIAVVENAGNRQQAQAAASAALAGVFKINVQSLTIATQNFSSTMSNTDIQLSENRDFNQQVNTTSDITGLMGVLTDYWTDPKTRSVYVCARMNKIEGAATYTSVITENDKVIAFLKKEATDNPATFEAYESLAVAVNLATMTDNYLSILSVLNSAARQNVKPAYGSAAAVEALKQQVARTIVITVTVKGDVSSRLSKAFGVVFSSRDFRTRAEKADNPYVLEADFQLQETDLKAGGNSFVRYELTAALLDKKGVEIFSFSENHREGHITMSEAKQRAIRSAEGAITEEGFAAKFDEYLASLLK
jgi:hypothetical protein